MQKRSTMQNQHGIVKIICLEECKKLSRYQTKYLVRTFIFIISTWPVDHVVH